MSVYALIKLIHVSCAVLSGLGFLLQGVWMLRNSAWRRHSAVRWLPHWIDTLLLVSALALVAQSGQWPWYFDWLATKLGLLLLYIVSGFLAISRWSERRWPMPVRAVLFGLAVALFLQILGIALTRQARGWLSLLGP